MHTPCFSYGKGVRPSVCVCYTMRLRDCDLIKTTQAMDHEISTVSSVNDSNFRIRKSKLLAEIQGVK